METPQENEPELEDQYNDQEGAVEIYSRWAILGFGIFFNVVFGGVLLVMNLFRAGLRQAGWTVLAFSIGYTLVTRLTINSLPLTLMTRLSLNTIADIAGAFILSNYFFPKYFPDDDYYPRSITNPLIVSIIISLSVLLAGHFISPDLKQLK